MSEVVSVDTVVVVSSYMEMSVVKKKAFHPFWFLLIGSSLYYYKSELVRRSLSSSPPSTSTLFRLASKCQITQEAKPKGVVQISGSTIEQKAEVFTIRESSGNAHQFKTSKEAKAKWWIEHLEEAKTKSPMDPPDREALLAASPTSKRTLAYRAKKTFGSKLVGSKLGSSTLSALDEDIKKITSAIKALVAIDAGSSRASEVKRNIMRIVLKVLIEWQRGTITERQLIEIDKPTRAAFNQFDRLYRNYKLHTAEAMKEGFLNAERNIQESVRILQGLLRPYLTAKNLLLIQNLSEYLSSAQFWMKLWDAEDPTGAIDKGLFALVQAMNHYTSLELETSDPPAAATSSSSSSSAPPATPK